SRSSRRSPVHRVFFVDWWLQSNHQSTKNEEGAQSSAPMTRLEVAAAGFAAAVIVHNADHVRRGADSLDRDVLVAGMVAIVVEVGIVALVFARHPRGPVLAGAGGAALALGYVVTHFLPAHPVLSHSFPRRHL